MAEELSDVMKREIRLFALESLVCQLYAMIYGMTGEPKSALAKWGKALLARAKTTGFPTLDPALSDLASAELEDAVSRLLEMQRAILEAG
jgi:hypothetical protein